MRGHQLEGAQKFKILKTKKKKTKKKKKTCSQQLIHNPQIPTLNREVEGKKKKKIKQKKK